MLTQFDSGWVNFVLFRETHKKEEKLLVDKLYSITHMKPDSGKNTN